MIRGEPKTHTEVSMGCKKFVDSATATESEETDLKILMGQAGSAPVHMNLPPQGPLGTYAESVTWQPTPQVPPSKKSDITKGDMQVRDRKREEKKLTAKETLRQIKEEEHQEELACQWETCWQEEKEHKWVLYKCVG